MADTMYEGGHLELNQIWASCIIAQSVQRDAQSYITQSNLIPIMKPVPILIPREVLAPTHD